MIPLSSNKGLCPISGLRKTVNMNTYKGMGFILYYNIFSTCQVNGFLPFPLPSSTYNPYPFPDHNYNGPLCSKYSRRYNEMAKFMSFFILPTESRSAGSYPPCPGSITIFAIVGGCRFLNISCGTATSLIIL